MHVIKSPIFLFSLPRSGSTLLQRMLMTHSEIASLAEPWILLPLVYATRKQGIYTEYNHAWSKLASTDFIKALPNGTADYREGLREFVLDLYSKQCRKGETYFLDKTPRYYLIINELAELFPDAKFIFLFRNPAEILGSILNTWSENNLKKVYMYESDLVMGPQLLSEGFTRLKNKAHSIHYHNLLINPKKELEAVCDYLGIPFQEQMVTEFTETKPKGSMGDILGMANYKNLSTEPKQKWTKFLNSYVFKTYFRKYITSLDSSVLLNLGFKKEELLLEIDRVPVKKIGSLRNWYFWIRGKLILSFKLNLITNRKGSKTNPAYFS